METLLFKLVVFMISISFGSCQWYWRSPNSCAERPVQAVCRMQPNPRTPRAERQPIHGVVVFTQRVTCMGHYSLQVKVSIGGLQADSNWTYHGLHVHQLGNFANGCEDMGPHYNPYNVNHGAQTDPINMRHVGDFGNVVKDPFGNIQGAIFDNIASLVGPMSILRRGIVLHEKADDLGRGGNAESRRTGNAGKRLACCTIVPI